jgi:histidine phosphotransferase ChpT
MTEPNASTAGCSPSLQLAELLATRLCHELAGVSGSLLGVLELAGEHPGTGNEAVALARETAQELIRRLHLLRAAWGVATSTMDRAQLQELLAGAPVGRRVQIDLSGLDQEASFPPPIARLLLNLALLGAESLCGEGRAALHGGPKVGIVTTIEGPRAAWPAALPEMLMDPCSVWRNLEGPRQVLAPLTALLAQENGLQLCFLLPASEAAGKKPSPLFLRPFAS